MIDSSRDDDQNPHASTGIHSFLSIDYSFLLLSVITYHSHFYFDICIVCLLLQDLIKKHVREHEVAG